MIFTNEEGYHVKCPQHSEIPKNQRSRHLPNACLVLDTILNNGWSRSNEEKADKYVDHCSNESETPEATPGYANNIEEFLDVSCQMLPPIKLISPEEVKMEIWKLNNRKAPGYDLMNKQVLNKMTRKDIIFLTTIAS
ncbi:hypothetical protein JTB14_004859 [Gonioctena quinquepunctata]|nr:hypothetical protein JTB14_004859 [Gonioctena quinquepunctata]